MAAVRGTGNSTEAMTCILVELTDVRYLSGNPIWQLRCPTKLRQRLRCLACSPIFQE
ncbi:hypothetical protein ABVT39_022190, partial [Epinephelus coioides]